MKGPSENEFLAAYDAHAEAIFRFCYVQIGDREKAKDLAQETFVRTWQYLVCGKSIDDWRPFLYKTARNLIIDQYRRNRTDSLDALTAKGFDLVDPANSAATTVEANRVLKAIDKLEPKYREVVVLRYVQDLPPREIAQVIGENENTISIRIHRGLEQVRSLLDPNHE